MLKIILLSITTLSLCFVIALLNVTTPATAGPFGILSIFFFAYVSSVGLVTFLLYWGSILVNKVYLILAIKKPFQLLTLKNSYYYSTIWGAVPVLLIGLQSVGSIGFYELFLVSIFAIIGSLYISKRIH